jgi:hypothetical protein
MIPHIGLRMILGSRALLIGLLLLLIFRNRDQNNLWGRFFRLGREMDQGRTSVCAQATVYLVSGTMALLAGAIVLLVGFRPVMEG